jgi:hypothetical protein
VDFDTAAILGLVGLLGLNYVAFIGDDWHLKRGRFWGVQAANLIGICFFVLVGSPKFKAEMPVVNYVLAGMLVLRSLMNNRRLQNALKDEAVGGSDAQDAKRQAVLDKLKSSDSSTDVESE